MQHIDWGLIEYNQAWSQQEQLFKKSIEQKLRDDTTENYLVFCEHPHVYTLGKSGNEQNLLLNYIQLQAKNAEFVHTNRGGDITYHGPGQLVGYPIFDLANFGMGLKQYIYTMEECIILLLKNYDIIAGRLEGATGVWLDVGAKSARKICAIGVRSSRFVTMHGFALNVNTQLEYFNYINPCGFIDKGVTSIEKETGRKIDLLSLKYNLRAIFEEKFNTQM
ncbi:MAG: lipoyl(octanoyl) transferase LipB [Paludibacter sp.]|nr:lipoyl(octanoyl) transferase LipB [Paludibacter sp.]